MVRAYLRLGHLSPQTEVRREGDALWTASGDVSLFANCGRGLPESHEVMGILDRAEQSAYDAQTVFAVQRGTPLFPQTPSQVPEAAGEAGEAAGAAPGAGADDDAEWFYLDEFKESRGPLSTAQLLKLFANEVATDESWVWSEALQPDWVQAKNSDSLKGIRLGARTVPRPRLKPAERPVASPSHFAREALVTSPDGPAAALSKAQGEIASMRGEIDRLAGKLSAKDGKLKAYKGRLREALQALDDRDRRIQELERKAAAAAAAARSPPPERNESISTTLQELEQKLDVKDAELHALKSLVSEKELDIEKARDALASELSWLVSPVKTMTASS